MTLGHIAHARVLWLHEGERSSIINIHQATGEQSHLQRRLNTHIQVEMQKSEGLWSIMGGELNVATSHTGYFVSKKSH